jgi:DNA-binding NtrC family response regulator
LPNANEHPHDQEPGKAEVRPVRQIFVVDDEKSIVSTLTAILNLSGYQARCFSNPLEALEAARTARPDLVISDVVMPELSGIDLAIQLREQCPECHVLLFSGQASTADLLMEARKRGYEFELLAKPVHPEDLLAKVRERSVNPTATDQAARGFTNPPGLPVRHTAGCDL